MKGGLTVSNFVFLHDLGFALMFLIVGLVDSKAYGVLDNVARDMECRGSCFQDVVSR